MLAWLFTMAATSLAGPAPQGVAVGVGGSAGGTVWLAGMDNGWSEVDEAFFEPAGSPTLAVSWGWDHGLVHPFAGMHSSPTFLSWHYDIGLVQLLVVDGGVSFGSSDLSAGPYGSIGAFSAGVGVRAVWTFFDLGPTGRSGIEARVGWVAPHAVQTTVMWTWRPRVAKGA